MIEIRRPEVCHAPNVWGRLPVVQLVAAPVYRIPRVRDALMRRKEHVASRDSAPGVRVVYTSMGETAVSGEPVR